MKRVWGHVLAGLTLLAGAEIVGSACAHDDSTVFVRDVLAPQLVAAGNLCVYTDQPTQTFIPSGVLDVAVAGSYQPVYLVGNQMVPRGDPNAPTTETSYVTIDQAVVRVTESGGQQIRTFTARTSATIAPSSGSTPSYAPIWVTTIDSATLTDPRVANVVNGAGVKKLVTYVRFLGKSLGGQSVESDEFAFPVDVCAGCLIRFSQQDINPDPRLPQPNCLGNASGSMLPSPCTPGQDAPIDCSQCLDNPACLGPAAFPGLVLDAGAG